MRRVAFVAERYVRDGTLRTQLDAPLNPSRAVAIARQIAMALDAARSRQLVHRDVKPDNILVDGNDTAYLIDFFVPTAAKAVLAAIAAHEAIAAHTWPDG